MPIETMSSKVDALKAVKVGDLVFGIAAGGQEKLLLVYEADAETFWTRHVMSQTTAKFGRDGKSQWVGDGGSCTIVSTAPLPPEMHAVALELDRKFASNPDYPDSIMSKAEVQLVLTHDKVFKQHLLPGAQELVTWAERINRARSILHLEWDPINARQHGPMWDEYLDDLPALVELLESDAGLEEVADFLTSIAAARSREHIVRQRTGVAAASLVRWRDGWS
jgi:hypothetical protein